MPEWYYRDRQDSTVGPLTPHELLDLIRGGELEEDTLVRKDDSQWVRSIEINGLWAAAARPDTEFFCPVCNCSISKPPCRCPKCLKYVDKSVGRIKKASISAKQLSKIREAASQPVQRSQPVVHSNVEESSPLAHTPKSLKQHSSSSAGGIHCYRKRSSCLLFRLFGNGFFVELESQSSLYIRIDTDKLESFGTILPKVVRFCFWKVLTHFVSAQVHCNSQS